MNRKKVLLIAPWALLILFVAFGSAFSQNVPKEVLIKTQNGKMPPVAFSHSTHVEKLKTECAACHHSDPKSPKACTTCHKLEAQGKALSAKDAFHQNCITCHKQQTDKAGKGPTKCYECHKK